MPLWTAQGGTRVGARWKWGPEPLLGFLREDRGEAESQVSTGQFEWFHQALGPLGCTQVVWYLASGAQGTGNVVQSVRGP